jgi:hypothetical protein
VKLSTVQVVAVAASAVVLALIRYGFEVWRQWPDRQIKRLEYERRKNGEDQRR